MLHTVARFTPVEWVLLDACDLAGNPTEVVCQADVDDYDDHGDICDHDDRDTIRFF